MKNYSAYLRAIADTHPPLSGVVSVLEIKLGDMHWEVPVCRGQEARSGTFPL